MFYTAHARRQMLARGITKMQVEELVEWSTPRRSPTRPYSLTFRMLHWMVVTDDTLSRVITVYRDIPGGRRSLYKHQPINPPLVRWG